MAERRHPSRRSEVSERCYRHVVRQVSSAQLSSAALTAKQGISNTGTDSFTGTTMSMGRAVRLHSGRSVMMRSIVSVRAVERRTGLMIVIERGGEQLRQPYGIVFTRYGAIFQSSRIGRGSHFTVDGPARFERAALVFSHATGSDGLDEVDSKNYIQSLSRACHLRPGAVTC